MDRLPQVLVNVRGVDRDGVDACAPLQEAVPRREAELGEYRAGAAAPVAAPSRWCG